MIIFCLDKFDDFYIKKHKHKSADHKYISRSSGR